MRRKATTALNYFHRPGCKCSLCWDDGWKTDNRSRATVPPSQGHGSEDFMAFQVPKALWKSRLRTKARRKGVDLSEDAEHQTIYGDAWYELLAYFSRSRKK